MRREQYISKCSKKGGRRRSRMEKYSEEEEEKILKIEEDEAEEKEGEMETDEYIDSTEENIKRRSKWWIPKCMRREEYISKCSKKGGIRRSSNILYCWFQSFNQYLQKHSYHERMKKYCEEEQEKVLKSEEDEDEEKEGEMETDEYIESTEENIKRLKQWQTYGGFDELDFVMARNWWIPKCMMRKGRTSKAATMGEDLDPGSLASSAVFCAEASDYKGLLLARRHPGICG
ncbi:uncharacterized protein LOC142652481 isoform X2 [Rhinoderma darwinii]|uniref:uncharacterized protein LOC142652481 isoform X2 n=1 Tax=Rhinoderma darwinii TaxID=43563 RepID=UPI003F66D9DF